MQLVNNIQHLTFITADMDRLINFYRRIFDAEVTLDLTEGPMRHVFIQVGDTTVLHPFQIPDINPPDSLPMFQRGRLDHFALNATSEEAFRELYRRVVAEGCDVDPVIDMGLMLLFSFKDPDNGIQEVVWWKPDGRQEGALRENWIYIDDYLTQA